MPELEDVSGLDTRSAQPNVPWWGVASALSAPVLLVAGWTVAARLQPAPFDPVSQTVSDLMEVGATDRWLMTGALLVTGVCYIATGAALRPAGKAGRLILVGGAMTGMLVAAAPLHPGISVWHGVWSVLGFAGLAAWPLLAWRRGPAVPWGLRRPACFTAVAVQLALLAWFIVEVVLTGGSGGWTGLIERLVGVAQALVPLMVVLSCRLSRPRRALEHGAVGVRGSNPALADRSLTWPLADMAEILSRREQQTPPFARL
jgi:hypothetical membrane protein